MNESYTHTHGNNRKSTINRSHNHSRIPNYLAPYKLTHTHTVDVTKPYPFPTLIIQETLRLSNGE